MRLPSIRLMLIDPHASYTELLAYYIQKEEPDLSVIGTATDAKDGMRMILEKNRMFWFVKPSCPVAELLILFLICVKDSGRPKLSF